MEENAGGIESVTALRHEIATLRAEMRALLRLLGIPEEGAALLGRTAPPDLRCASLTVTGDGGGTGSPGARLWADETGAGHLTLTGNGEHSASLTMADPTAGESGTLATLTATEDGAALALCGRDGVPRVVLAGRDAGGGMSLVDARRDLAAELFGVAEASWLALYRGGQPALLAYGIPGADAAVEVYDEEAARRGALPGA